jgi:acyl carrier protein
MMMDNDQLMQQLSVIFRDVFENDDIGVTRETTANDIAEWDSLNHFQLIAALEKHFKIRFTTNEIYKWKNVGDMCDAIAGKLQN